MDSADQERWNAHPVDAERIAKAIMDLARNGAIDVTGWFTNDILSLLASVPAWVDLSATLIPEWTAKGPSRHIALANKADPLQPVRDRRIIPVNDELLFIKRKLENCRNRAELIAAMDQSQRSSLGPPVAFTKPNTDLEHVIERWADEGSARLSPADRSVLLHDEVESVTMLSQLSRKLPSARRPDEVALVLLSGAEDHVDSQLIVSILPDEDSAVMGYVISRPSISILEAAMTLNRNLKRSIDIRIKGGSACAALIEVVERSKVDTGLLYGLTRSVEISSLGAGSLVRSLFTCPGIDYSHLYMNVLPAASGGRTDSLLGLVSINPAAFVAWLGAPDPYADALVEALRHETQQAIWKRISRFVSRWKRSEMEAGHHRASDSSTGMLPGS
jgi:hypothetical protein